MLLKLAKVVIPAMLSQTFIFFMEIVNMFFIGHLNDPAMVAGVGLGNMYVNIVCQSLILGLNGGVGTLVAQAYGSKNMRKCGVYLNRGRIITLMCYIPMVFSILMCERVLLFIGQDPAASRFAQQYVYAIIPGMFFHGQFDATRQYLISMHRNLLVTVVMITTSLLHMLWCYLLVNIAQMGVQGASLAMLISYTLNFFLITLFCMAATDLRDSFFFFTKDTFGEFSEYLKIGIPSAVMLCLEWGGFECFIIIAGLISVDVSGAQVVILNTFFVIMMLSLGCQQGALACVGKAMGEGNNKKARIYLKITVIGSIIMNFIVAFVITIFKDPISTIFTKNKLIVEQISDSMTLMAVVTIINGTQLVLAGGIKGIGLQYQATFIILICVYFISLPLSYVFAIVLQLKLKGIWLAIIIGTSMQTLVYLYLLSCRISWKKMATKIQTKMREKENLEMLRHQSQSQLQVFLSTHHTTAQDQEITEMQQQSQKGQILSKDFSSKYKSLGKYKVFDDDLKDPYSPINKQKDYQLKPKVF
ncbi:na+-driven multidrug efflux pump [Stylonychia lemnae]|uniref:Na+-driven multidrug efflux pump n=1 Tax=Stylonychia lemnae TaxID=5949 RepID=A0A078ADG7_STYLE|nr:na+-driven multidrug efflux pump [Stylonychia lemnae]|eukprot:CDW80289.1 na+-driven multidrug efflux pump [Stylonychia lemnae]